jgi:hypothetical protein
MHFHQPKRPRDRVCFAILARGVSVGQWLLVQGSSFAIDTAETLHRDREFCGIGEWATQGEGWWAMVK